MNDGAKSPVNKKAQNQATFTFPIDVIKRTRRFIEARQPRIQSRP